MFGEEVEDKMEEVEGRFDRTTTRITLSGEQKQPAAACGGGGGGGGGGSTVVAVNGFSPHPRPRPPPPVTPADLRERLSAMRRWFHQFDSNQRTLALQAIMPFLDSPQLHRLSQHLPAQDLHSFCPPGCNDFFLSLPLHVTRKIVEHLDPVSIVRAAQVCRHWRDVMESPWIWRRLSFLPPWRLSPAESSEQIERRKSTDSAEEGTAAGEEEGRGQSVNWKRVFRERYKLRRCWLRGQCHVRTFEGHSGGISCVQFDSTRIVSGSHDKTIRVWNIKTNSPWSVMTLVGHSGEVRCLHLHGDRLASGGTDGTIKVWDLDMQWPEWSSIGCKVTMVGHQDTVRCVQMSSLKESVISGSYDATLKVWCLKTGNCLQTLRGHEDRVLCLFWEEGGDRLFSGSTDRTIKSWSLESGGCLYTLRGHADAVTCLSRESGKLVSGSLDRTIKLWDADTGLCLSTLDWMSAEGHTGVIRCLQADPWRIVSASDDKTLKVWCLESGQRLVTLRSHTDGVTCLRFNDFHIVSGSYDKTVKLWDFTVC